MRVSGRDLTPLPRAPTPQPARRGLLTQPRIVQSPTGVDGGLGEGGERVVNVGMVRDGTDPEVHGHAGDVIIQELLYLTDQFHPPALVRLLAHPLSQVIQL